MELTREPTNGSPINPDMNSVPSTAKRPRFNVALEDEGEDDYQASQSMFTSSDNLLLGSKDGGEKPPIQAEDEEGINSDDLMEMVNELVDHVFAKGKGKEASGSGIFPSVLGDQWKCIAPNINLDNPPEILKKFLEGKLSTKRFSLDEILEFLDSSPEECYGVILPSFFILELFMKLRNFPSLLKLYEMSRRSSLKPCFTDLIVCIVMHKLQRNVHCITKDLEVPLNLESALNLRPLVEDMEGSKKNDELTILDESLLIQIEKILIQIVSNAEIYKPETEKPADFKIAGEAVKLFCTSLVKVVMNSAALGKFGNVYDLMMMHSLDHNLGNPALYINAVNAIGINFPVKIHPYNASLHGIKPVDPDNIQTVNVSVSGIEITTFLELMYTGKPGCHFYGLINLPVYEIAKALRVPDIKLFLFRSTPIIRFAETGSRKDLLLICVKERLEDLFDQVPSLTTWLPIEDKGNLLNRLSTQEVIWFLDRKQTPFANELEVYVMLVNWALSKCGLEPVVWDQFKSCRSELIIEKFNEVFPYCLCLLDLEKHYVALIRDGFIDRDLIQSASEYHRNSATTLDHSAMRRRAEI